MTYRLEVIPGTEQFVKQELLKNFHDSEIISTERGSIEFSNPSEEVDDFKLLSALRITKENGLTRNLFRRDWKVETSPAGINPALAYILCMIGEINSEDIVFDPFCGAGTISITAAKYFEPKKVLCSDKSGKAVDMTIENIKAAGIKKGKIIAFRSNIKMIKLKKNSVSIIITNPPFGVRTGNHEENIKIYSDLKDKAKSLLRDGGKIIIITQEKKLIEENFHRDFFSISERTDITQGGLHPTIFKIDKLVSKS